ncbi:MAG: hypothetical protein Q8P70_01465 [bacterium]|nr:hypothetical protein [bacterium]MDZ4221822.1 hypothetical protein [Patescibacteria group bacterium]
MKNNIVFFVLFALILAIGVGVRAFAVSVGERESQKQEIQTGLETQTISAGTVTISVTPTRALEGEMLFSVLLDTHSVELTANLERDAVLQTNQGKEYRPTGWEGDPPGGHHRTGVLAFSLTSPLPQSITLLLSGVEGETPQSFFWILP